MQSSFLFGGYATPTKCVAFWRLALHSYNILSVKQPITLLSEKPCDNNSVKQNRCLAHFNAPDTGHGIWDRADRGYAQVGFDRNGNADGHEKKPGKIHVYIVGSE